MKRGAQQAQDDPLWYKDAVIYELHVKSFSDSNADGIGDFPGLTSRLPYLKSLGVTAIWLLPFYPSPLRDDGYDISDHFGINPDYGTMSDFRDFLKEAKRLGLRVITELVVNHTSDQHPWFKRARAARPGSSARDFYVWSDTAEKYRDARIIFKDFESSNWTWDPAAKAYYWHRFYHHQPDLNFENPAVQKELFKVVDFWLGMGVDGMRLDAVPYLYEEEGTSCENLPQTHAFLKKLRAHVDSRFKGRMLLCEANQWPEDAAAYFGAGDECNMAFHFPVMPRLFMSLWMEDSFPVTDILDQTPAIPESCQWAVFLRNHDELTLEMVTDEERDYMYKVYARDAKARINLGIRRRLAPLLGNNRRKIELMNILLFSLPGTPVLYYGDEIGMGDNFYLGDRNGVRTPMQWSPDRNAGFSTANPQKLFLPVVTDPEYHYEAVNVESNEGNLSSLLWWMKRVIAMRDGYKSFGRGSFEPVRSSNPKVLAFARRYGEEIMLVVANLSRFSQSASLDLTRYAGYIPVEVFGGHKFPPITDKHYQLTPGFHNYYWFQLLKGQGPAQPEPKALPELNFPGEDWASFTAGRRAQALDPALEEYLRRGGPSRYEAEGLRSAAVSELFPLPSGAVLAAVSAYHPQGRSETLLLALRFVSGAAAEEASRRRPERIVAAAVFAGEKGLIVDALYDPVFHADLLSLFITRRKARCGKVELRAAASQAFLRSLDTNPMPSDSKVLKSGADGATILYGSQYVLRFRHRLEEGPSQDLELGLRMTESGEPGAPVTFGSLNLGRAGKFLGTIAVLRSFVPNQGTAWTLMLNEVSKFYEAMLSTPPAGAPPPLPAPGPLEVKDIPAALTAASGAVAFEMAAMLGHRLGKVHSALASGTGPEYAPEPFSRLYQRSVYQSIAGHAKKSLMAASSRLQGAAPEGAEDIAAVLDGQQRLLRLVHRLNERKFAARRVRIHGNCTLRQALFTGKDFVFTDFGGDPARASGERRIKRSPLRDTASMLFSFYYAAHAPFLLPGGIPRKEMGPFAPWLRLWYACAAGSFLRGYCHATAGLQLLPPDCAEAMDLLDIFLAEKAVLALPEEMAARPDWAFIPARFLRALIERV